MPAVIDGARPVRWGILGAGRIAATVGADIRDSPDSEVVAVAARGLDRAQRLATELGAARAYGSYDELAADDALDIVYVATTHAQHYEHTLLALRAGRAVLIEKPVALNRRQAEELFAEAAARDVFCLEAMWMRFNPLIRRAQAIVGAGELGDVLSVRAGLSFRAEYDPHDRLFDLAVGGGALLDIGIYPATFAWIFLGGAPDRVATTGWLAPTGADAMAAMQWSYPDGRYAHLTCAVRVAGSSEAVIAGSTGWIRFRGPFHHPTRIEIHRGDQVETETSELPGNGYGPQVAEVERCLRAGLFESPLVPWRDTIGILGVLDDARAELGVRYPVDATS